MLRSQNKLQTNPWKAEDKEDKYVLENSLFQNIHVR